MGKIHAVDRDGSERVLDARPGLSLMEILRDGGLPIEAICGGQCICSTCHVYVDDAWLDKLTPRAADEQVMVEDTGHFQENSRLACQGPYVEALDGIRVTLAPAY